MTDTATELAATIYPMDCPLCGCRIDSLDDRTFWHGLGSCAGLCGLCEGAGEVESSQCPVCAGTGLEKEKSA